MGFMASGMIMILLGTMLLEHRLAKKKRKFQEPYSMNT